MRERLRDLDVAIATLPAHLRQAITLYAIDELQFSEVARRLDVSKETAQHYVAEALAQCHAVLRANSEG